MKIEIFRGTVHYPEVSSGVSEECKKMFFRVKQGKAEAMVFNDVLIVMANKEDVLSMDVLQLEEGLGLKVGDRR